MNYDILIIGAGPAGYVAAIRAGQLGLKTALVEKNELGGMCLNWGCIPTKALIESAKFYHKVKSAEEMGIDGIDQNNLVFNWANAKKRAGKVVKKLTGGVEYLLKKNGVEIIQGEAKINSDKSVTVGKHSIIAKNIIIATGSYPGTVDLPFQEDKLIQIEQLLFLEELPQRIVLFGHGPISLELAQFFKMTDRDVWLVSKTDDILPGIDSSLKDFIIKKVKSQGINMLIAEEIKQTEDHNLLINGELIEFDLAVNCSWRKAVLPENNIDLELSPDGYIQVDENLQTNVPGIFAVGDVNGLSYLAHVASAQGTFAINHIQGIRDKMDIRNFPINIYTYPEMAQIGLTEKEIISKGLEFKVGEFPMTANGKALSEGTAEGFIRILSEKKFGEVLGVQIVASNATDLIAEAAAYLSVEATVYDVARTVHAHPTISEVFLEAGMDAADSAIHK